MRRTSTLLCLLLAACTSEAGSASKPSSKQATAKAAPDAKTTPQSPPAKAPQGTQDPKAA